MNTILTAIYLYTLFVPLIVVPIPNLRQGVAVIMAHEIPADVDLVGASWWYNWWHSPNIPDSRFVPMSWAGEDPQLAPDYVGYLLVLNEPENTQQANLTPAEGAARVLLLASLYPYAKLIVGGTGIINGPEWMAQLLIAMGTYRPAGFHIHAYIEGAITSAMIGQYISNMRQLLPGELWLTEFGDTLGNGRELMSLVAASEADRFSWFANRMDIGADYMPSYWFNDFSLVDSGGQLTQFGEYYKCIGKTGHSC